MTTENRTEESVLHPANIKLLELRIAWSRTSTTVIVSTTEEAADICIEVGITRQGKAQSGRNLLAQHIPRRIDITTPHIGAVMLLTGKGGAGHDKHALLAGISGGIALRLIHATDSFQREGIAQGTPCTTFLTSLMGICCRRTVEAVGVGRIHPPCICTIIMECLQVLPVDSSCLRRESVIHFHTRGIILTWRPESESTLRPCLKVKKQILFLEFLISLGHGTETGPDAYHKVGTQFMNLINHLTTIGKLLRKEIHCIPQIIGAPILPVLDDSIQRNTQLSVLLHNAQCLIGTLITFLTLPVTVGPQGEHRHITC